MSAAPSGDDMQRFIAEWAPSTVPWRHTLRDYPPVPRSPVAARRPRARPGTTEKPAGTWSVAPASGPAVSPLTALTHRSPGRSSGVVAVVGGTSGNDSDGSVPRPRWSAAPAFDVFARQALPGHRILPQREYEHRKRKADADVDLAALAAVETAHRDALLRSEAAARESLARCASAALGQLLTPRHVAELRRLGAMARVQEDEEAVRLALEGDQDACLADAVREEARALAAVVHCRRLLDDEARARAAIAAEAALQLRITAGRRDSLAQRAAYRDQMQAVAAQRHSDDGDATSPPPPPDSGGEARALFLSGDHSGEEPPSPVVADRSPSEDSELLSPLDELRIAAGYAHLASGARADAAALAEIDEESARGAIAADEADGAHRAAEWHVVAAEAIARKDNVRSFVRSVAAAEQRWDAVLAAGRLADDEAHRRALISDAADAAVDAAIATLCAALDAADALEVVLETEASDRAAVAEDEEEQRGWLLDAAALSAAEAEATARRRHEKAELEAEVERLRQDVRDQRARRHTVVLSSAADDEEDGRRRLCDFEGRAYAMLYSDLLTGAAAAAANGAAALHSLCVSELAARVTLVSAALAAHGDAVAAVAEGEDQHTFALDEATERSTIIEAEAASRTALQATIRGLLADEADIRGAVDRAALEQSEGTARDGVERQERIARSLLRVEMAAAGCDGDLGGSMASSSSLGRSRSGRPWLRDSKADIAAAEAAARAALSALFDVLSAESAARDAVRTAAGASWHQLLNAHRTAEAGFLGGALEAAEVAGRWVVESAEAAAAERLSLEITAVGGAPVTKHTTSALHVGGHDDTDAAAWGTDTRSPGVDVTAPAPMQDSKASIAAEEQRARRGLEALRDLLQAEAAARARLQSDAGSCAAALDASRRHSLESARRSEAEAEAAVAAQRALRDSIAAALLRLELAAVGAWAPGGGEPVGDPFAGSGAGDPSRWGSKADIAAAERLERGGLHDLWALHEAEARGRRSISDGAAVSWNALVAGHAAALQAARDAADADAAMAAAETEAAAALASGLAALQEREAAARAALVERSALSAALLLLEAAAFGAPPDSPGEQFNSGAEGRGGRSRVEYATGSKAGIADAEAAERAALEGRMGLQTTEITDRQRLSDEADAAWTALDRAWEKSLEAARKAEAGAAAAAAAEVERQRAEAEDAARQKAVEDAAAKARARAAARAAAAAAHAAAEKAAAEEAAALQARLVASEGREASARDFIAASEAAAFREMLHRVRNLRAEGEEEAARDAVSRLEAEARRSLAAALAVRPKRKVPRLTPQQKRELQKEALLIKTGFIGLWAVETGGKAPQVVVDSLHVGGPTEQAGGKLGDIITHIGGAPITTLATMRAAFSRSARVSQPLHLTLRREADGKVRDKSVNVTVLTTDDRFVGCDFFFDADAAPRQQRRRNSSAAPVRVRRGSTVLDDGPTPAPMPASRRPSAAPE